MPVRKLILTLVLAAASLPLFSQRVSSVTVPDLNGRLVSFRVYSTPSLNNVAKADLINRRILINWDRLLRYDPSDQTIRLVLAHEAGHLVYQDLSAEREYKADYFAGRTMRIEGYTSRDMAVVRQDMLRILGRGDSTHPPAEERVRITMQGYNSVASRPAQTLRASGPRTQTWNSSATSGGGGGWRKFGQNSLR